MYVTILLLPVTVHLTAYVPSAQVKVPHFQQPQVTLFMPLFLLTPAVKWLKKELVPLLPAHLDMHVGLLPVQQTALYVEH